VRHVCVQRLGGRVQLALRRREVRVIMQSVRVVRGDAWPRAVRPFAHHPVYARSDSSYGAFGLIWFQNICFY
jgi:hypothetical protein